MFRNEGIIIKRAPKTKKPETLDDQIAQGIGASAARVFHDTAKDLLKPAALYTVGAIVAIKVVDALCEIAINKTT